MQRETMHINLDDLLGTADGRICTHERTAEALRQCFTMLGSALARANDKTTVYVLIGAQASGKTTWARVKAAHDPDAIVFDFIRVKKSERAPILTAALAARVPVVAVWFKTSLDDCLTRNAGRSLNERVDEEALRNVFAALEPPSVEEGFARIQEVHKDTRGNDQSV